MQANKQKSVNHLFSLTSWNWISVSATERNPYWFTREYIFMAYIDSDTLPETVALCLYFSGLWKRRCFYGVRFINSFIYSCRHLSSHPFIHHYFKKNVYHRHWLITGVKKMLFKVWSYGQMTLENTHFSPYFQG